MNRTVLGVDPWRAVVMVQTVALTVHAAPPDGYGGRLVALGALALVALMTMWMVTSRPTLPRWLQGWSLVAVAFSAFAGLSALWSVAPRVSLEDAVTTSVMLAFLVLTAATRWQDQSTLRADLTFVFGVVVALQGSALLAGGLGIDTIYDPDYGRFRGWFSNANYAGIISALGLSVGMGHLLMRPSEARSLPDDASSAKVGRVAKWSSGRNLTTWVLVAFLPLWAALVLAQSRGATLALVLSVVVAVLPRLGWQRSLGIVGAAAVAAVAVVVLNGLTNEPPGADLVSSSEPGGHQSPSFDPITRDDETDVTSGRVGIYKELVATIGDHPVAGTGYRTTELNPGLDGSAGHNIYLSTFAETGLVGGLLFVALLGLPLFRAMSEYSPRLGAPAAAGAVMVALSEVFESSILGWGSPTTLLAWFAVVAGACATTATQTPERRYEAST